MADGSVKIDITADDSDIKKKLNNVEDAAEEAADKLEDLGDSSQTSGKGFDIASVAIGNFISGGITALIGKVGEAISSLIALADETREYRDDMAKLNSAFTTAGHGAESAQKAYDGFYKILGESDRTVEAVNHLAEMTKNEKELAQWTTICAGVTARFGDSLPIEGLTEAANETAKVGAVTGPLADALTWAGISEDAFNEKLAACNSEQERAALITSTLTTEYQEAAAEYNELTASTQAAREATNRMEQAQADLGAKIEPLTTWWTNAKASMLSWAADGVASVVEGITTLATNTDLLSEKQRALVNETAAAAQAYKDTKEAAAELAAAQMADVNYATNTLLPQLQELVDSNGRVKQGYEERATFIMGQLSEAYGQEFTHISQIIGKNGELTQAIENVINAKKTEILLEEHGKAYKAAIKNIDAEMTKRDELLAGMSEHALKLEEIERRKRDIYKATEDGYSSGVESQIRQAMIKRSKIDAEYNAEKAKLEELSGAYNTSNELIKGYNNDIAVYTEATTLVMQGKTAEAIGYLQNLNKEGYQKTESQAKKTAAEQTAAVEDRLKKAAITLGLLKEEYKTNETQMTEEQKKEMQNRIKAAQEQVEAIGTEAEKLGSNLVEGIGIGADGKKDWLAGKLGGIVTAAIEAAKKVGIIKSPSRKMRDEVGKMLALGMAVGIEEWANKPVEAIEGVFNALLKKTKEGQKGIVETVKDYNTEIAEETTAHYQEKQRILTEAADAEAEIKKSSNERRLELEEQYLKDKAKEGANHLELEKEHNKKVAKEVADTTKKLAELQRKKDADLEKENDRHVAAVEKSNDNIKNIIKTRMTEVVALEEKYKSDVSKVWEDLAKSIEDVQANYDNQLKSRTESIANSLNLWGEVTRERVSSTVLTKNLRTQIGALEDFNKAIATLEERDINAGLINSLKTMGVGSVDEIRAISKMTDKELSKYVELWEKKNELAKNAAIEELEPLKAETEVKIEELTTAALDKYATLRAEYQEEATLLMTELKQAMIEAGQGGYEELIGQIDEYTSAGEDLMGGVIKGIIDKSPLVAEAVKKAVNKSILAAQVAAGTGASITFSSEKDKALADMQKFKSDIQTAVMIEQGKMSQNVGARDMGFSEVAQAVGLQTAGINSLASEYRRGSNAQVTVPLVIDGRELGRAIVDLGNAETIRTGTNLVIA